jgi:hypothetical protein
VWKERKKGRPILSGEVMNDKVLEISSSLHMESEEVRRLKFFTHLLRA